MAMSDFEYVRVIGDCDVFTLEYKPKGGKDQRTRLDAADEASALFEAACMIEVDESELEIEWC